jgi:hypothetical protein
VILELVLRAEETRIRPGSPLSKRGVCQRWEAASNVNDVGTSDRKTTGLSRRQLAPGSVNPEWLSGV